MGAFQRAGSWWQQQPDGSWLRWNDEAQRWEPQPSPPPPPDPGEDVPEPTGYQPSSYDPSSYQPSSYDQSSYQPGQYPQGQYPPGYPPYAGGQAANNGLAIGSLICGIVSILFCGILLGPVAIGLGFVARKQIAESGGRQTGGGMAMAGIIMGAAAVLLFFLFLALGFGGAFMTEFDTQ